MLIGTVDLGGIDLGNVDTFGDVHGLARVLGGRACKRGGRWVLEGGVRDTVRLDHPTVLRVLGEPLEAEPGTVRYESTGDDVRPPEGMPDTAPDTWTPGPALMAWYWGLSCPLTCEYGAAVMNERVTGCAALIPAGMTASQAARVRETIDELAHRDAFGAAPDTAAPEPTTSETTIKTGRRAVTVRASSDGAVEVTADGQTYRATVDPRGVLHGVSGWGWTDGAALLAVRAAVLDLRRHAA